MARVLGAVLSGVDGVPVEVEVRIHAQLPRVDVVGLPEAAVRESAARVRAAIAAARRFRGSVAGRCSTTCAAR